MSEGLAGGHPGAPCHFSWVHNNEAAEAGRNVNAYATTLDDMTGDKQSVSWGVFPLMGEDALYVRSDGGGGFGDPIAREPEALVADVALGAISKNVAADVYGVVLRDGTVDEVATKARRASICESRLAREAAE